MKNTKKTRSPALDLIRIFALFCVVSLHFFLYSGYYETTILGGSLYLATLARSFFMICVPLFLLLTGYLMRHKKATKAYYAKLIRIIGEYVLASMFCMVSLAVYHGEGLIDTIKVFLLQIPGIFSFEAAIYSWYVEMYIGLFLLIPYLNILYNGLDTKRAKQGLIFTMLLLSGIPEVLNSAIFTLPWTMWYNDPSGVLTLFPNWWTNLYPVTFYFIGAYLSEYSLPLSKKKAHLLLAISNLLTGTVSYLNSMGTTFNWGSWQTYQSLFVIVQAVMIFWLFLQLDFCHIGSRSRKLIALLSDLSFSAYLVSSVYDIFFQQIIGKITGSPVYSPLLYFVLVPLILFCSLVTAYILVSVYKLIQRFFIR